MGNTLTVTLTGDEHRLLKAMDRVIDKERKLAVAAEKAGKKAGEGGKHAARGMDKAGNARDKAFGSKALGQLSTFAMGFVSVGAAVAGVIKLLNEMNAAREKAAQSVKESEGGLASLAQLALGDKAKLDRLVEASKTMYREGGAKSVDEAAKTVFALESAGALGQQKLFARMYGIEEDIAGLARAATTIQTSVGKEETGSIKAIISKGFAASKYAPATVAQLLEAAAKGGVGARRLKISDEGLLAMTTIMAKATGSPEEGGTTVASLITSMQKMGGFKGLGVIKSLEKLRKIETEGIALTDDQILKTLVEETDVGGRKKIKERIAKFRGKAYTTPEVIGELEKSEYGGRIGELKGRRKAPTEAEMIALLGRKEAFRAYGVLSQNMPLLQQIIGELKTAEEEDLAEKIIQSRELSPELNIVRKGRMQAAELELAERPMGLTREISDTILKRLKTESLDAGNGEAVAILGDWWRRGRRFVSNKEVFIDDYGTTDERRDLSRAGGVSTIGRGDYQDLRIGTPDTDIAAAVEKGARAGMEAGTQSPTLGRPDEDR